MHGSIRVVSALAIKQKNVYRGKFFHIHEYSGYTIIRDSRVSEYTVFENRRKSLIQHCKRSELRLYFEWTKINQNCQKWSILASF